MGNTLVDHRHCHTRPDRFVEADSGNAQITDLCRCRLGSVEDGLARRVRDQVL
jgi:hypothetical protein